MSDNYWADWQQNKRIDAAEEQLALERRARNRLSEQMRTQQGNLQGQIDRLTRALVALVEHEDIRAELGQYADAAGCRRYAREVVSTVIVTGGAALRGAVDPADVPGYWLAAAARGVAATARGDAGGDALLTEAGHRDPQRAALFLSLLSAQTRDPRWATSPLERVLPDQPAISVAQREIWLAIADGRLAPTHTDAVAELVAALTQQVAAQADAADQVATWLQAEAGTTRDALAAEQAATQLNTLRQVLASGARSDRGAVEPDSMIAAVLRADRSAEPAPVATSEDPLADCLRSLVDEGSPAEGDILDRMATVRVDLGFLDERTATMTADWSSPVGDVVALLLSDLEDADSPRFAVARQVLTPTLLPLADQLARQAAVPVEDTRPVKVAGGIATVDTTGATAAWQAGVLEAVTRRNPINPFLLPIGAGLIMLGLVFAGLTFVATGWLVLAIAGILGGAGALFASFRERTDLAEEKERTLRSTERDLAVAAETLRADKARGVTAAAAAQEHLSAVRDTLQQRV
ncbi:hypothetical protein [Nocardioides sp. WS12]|uniref:hypothetical protein n=1 Tax=Nocardioides sp. WS12 TaxID=2486272 RepID=UPI0015F95936|nr:hypothetical protein [Nocardioides sp. WS12]